MATPDFLTMSPSSADHLKSFEEPDPDVPEKIKSINVKNLNLLKLHLTTTAVDQDYSNFQEDNDGSRYRLQYTNEDGNEVVCGLNDDDVEDTVSSILLWSSPIQLEHPIQPFPADSELDLSNENENCIDNDNAGDSLGIKEEETSTSTSTSTKTNTNVDSIIDDNEPNQDDSFSHKKFKDRAVELKKKTEGEHSHFVKRVLSSDDWLFIHRVIRKSKGLKSKFMIKNLTPLLFEKPHTVSWKCNFCKEMIPSPPKNYVDHVNSQHDLGIDEEVLFPCDVCGEFVKPEKYVVHWVPHFMEHKCDICHKAFALHCHMTYHYKVVHEVGEQTCFQCGRLVKNDLAMKRHLRIFHSNRTNWKHCDICGKRVKSRCLEPHKLTHSHERAYKCDICQKCFKTPSTLYQHQKVHATDSKAYKYLCEYCGARFKHHTSWNLHVVRIHEGEYEHQCPVCNKRFHKLFELKKHSVKHSDDRRFPCSTCNKCFKTKTHLKEHITIHSEKCHFCPLCGKSIRMKANLYKHLKVHRNRGEFVPSLNGNSINNFGFISHNTMLNLKNNGSSSNNNSKNNNNNTSNNNNNNSNNSKSSTISSRPSSTVTTTTTTNEITTEPITPTTTLTSISATNDHDNDDNNSLHNATENFIDNSNNTNSATTTTCTTPDKYQDDATSTNSVVTATGASFDGTFSFVTTNLAGESSTYVLCTSDSLSSEIMAATTGETTNNSSSSMMMDFKEDRIQEGNVAISCVDDDDDGTNPSLKLLNDNDEQQQQGGEVHDQQEQNVDINDKFDYEKYNSFILNPDGTLSSISNQIHHNTLALSASTTSTSDSSDLVSATADPSSISISEHNNYAVQQINCNNDINHSGSNGNDNDDGIDANNLIPITSTQFHRLDGHAANNIISLIAHTQNETICFGGTTLTHLILVNHNPSSS